MSIPLAILLFVLLFACADCVFAFGRASQFTVRVRIRVLTCPLSHVVPRTMTPLHQLTLLCIGHGRVQSRRPLKTPSHQFAALRRSLCVSVDLSTQSCCSTDHDTVASVHSALHRHRRISSLLCVGQYVSVDLSTHSHVVPRTMTPLYQFILLCTSYCLRHV